MREDLKDWLLLMGKSLVMVVGGVLVLAGLVDLVVLRGASLRGAVALAVGLLLAVPPLALAFRDAVRSGRAR